MGELETRIPKVIHYCWFGGNPLPELVRNCIKSWKKYCPDYEIVEWNESNFDIHSNLFVEQAYQAKKWAFVADYVRLYALYHCGGVYMDSDVEILQPIDRFLTDSAFNGFETKDSPVTAVMGCVKGHKLFGELLDYYRDRPFIVDGKYDMTPNTKIITGMMVERGIKLNGKQQTVCDCVFYPEIVFCPNNIRRIFYRYSKRSYAVHHILGSWGVTPTYKRKFHKRVLMCCVRMCRDTIGTPATARIRGLFKKDG